MNPSGNQTPTNGSNSTTNATPNYNTGYNYSAPNLNVNSVSGITLPGTNQSAGGYQMPDLTNAANNQNTNSQAFNQSQANQTSAFQGAYNAAAQALPSYQTLQNNANAQYGVQPLAQQAANLNSEVLQIPQTYSQATQGSDTNNNQLMQLIGQKQWELDPLQASANTQAQTAEGLANTMVQAGVNNEAQLLSPYANTTGLVQGQEANAAANFTSDQAAQLSALTSLANSGAQLSANQLTQLSALQQQQLQSNAMVAAAQAQAAGNVAAAQAGQQYKIVSPSQGVWNASTGTVSQPYNSSAPQIPGSSINA